MNTVDRTTGTIEDYRPILHVETPDAVARQQPECTCPEFCLLDHDN